MADLPSTFPAPVFIDPLAEAGCAAMDYPPPSFDEAHAEWLKFYRLPVADIDPTGEHAGQYVAVFGGTIRGYDADPIALRMRVAEELHVHPERLVISYLDG